MFYSLIIVPEQQTKGYNERKHAFERFVAKIEVCMKYLFSNIQDGSHNTWYEQLKSWCVLVSMRSVIDFFSFFNHPGESINRWKESKTGQQQEIM